jgi:MFS family permease
VSSRTRRGRPAPRRDVATTFLRWMYMRAVFHRGYVLVSSLYFVINAHLTASQLVLLGTAVSATLFLSDIPTGVWSDTISRKWPLVIGHMFLAVGMVMTGVVTAFPLLLVTQVLWGLGWGFSSGADVAWITDELDQPDRIARVLTARGRMDLLGAATGMVAFGLLGWVTSLGTAILVSGMAMALLGLFVAARFLEDNFVPLRGQQSRAWLGLLRRGVTLARRDHEILLVLCATLIVNAAGKVTWVFPKQLLNVGFPRNPVLWYTALMVLAFAVGATALRVVEKRIDGVGVVRQTYAFTCFIGVVGLIMLAYAANALIGSVGVLLVSGISFSVTRAVSVIWVNRRVTSDVRATAHSFLGQAEYVGEVVAGFVLAAISRATGITVTLVTAAALIACAGAMVARSRADRAATPMRTP